MTAEQLRNSILQEAISGRLVPQDPNDEPAAVLLQRIREEKARLVKEGTIKAKEVQEYTIDDIPYELPDNWSWVKLGEISYPIKRGKSPVYVENSQYIAFAQKCNTKKGYIDLGLAKYIESKKAETQADIYLKLGDIVINSTGTGTLGRVGLFNVEYPENIIGVVPDSHVATVRLLSIYPEYAYYFLRTCQAYLESLGEGGTNQKELKPSSIAELLFPLPPLAEQRRIVAKLEELLPIVEQYGKAQKELDELNAALPARLRQSILQEAISGKLVPQDENETADGLKEQLLLAVNNSHLKKKWNSEPIEEDELPFDIPENWKWIRLGDIVYTQTGLSYSKGDLEKKVPDPIRVLRGGNIQNGAWCTKDDDVMIAPEFVKKDIFLTKNSFITPAVTSLEHLGKTALIRENHNDIVAGGFVLYLMPYDDKNDVLMEYLAYFFQSAFYNSFCKTITNKSGQAFWNISREKLLKLTIPLPPLAEQQRIVAKIEELFAEIDKLVK